MVNVIVDGKEFKKMVKKLREFVSDEERWADYSLHTILFIDKDMENASIDAILVDKSGSSIEDWITLGKVRIKSVSVDGKIPVVPIGHTRQWMIEKLVENTTDEDVSITIRDDNAVFINNVSV